MLSSTIPVIMLHVQLPQKTQEHTKVQLPFVGSGANDELNGLYKRVCKAMNRVHNRKKFDHLQKLALEW